MSYRLLCNDLEKAKNKKQIQNKQMKRKDFLLTNVIALRLRKNLFFFERALRKNLLDPTPFGSNEGKKKFTLNQLVQPHPKKLIDYSQNIQPLPIAFRYSWTLPKEKNPEKRICDSVDSKDREEVCVVVNGAVV